MARTPKTDTADRLPDDFTPTQAVPDPILNGPYDEPGEHWIYQKQGGVSVPFKAGGRRESRYFYKVKKVGTATAQQELGLVADEGSDRLELPNRLRDDVKRWREARYRGASPVTRDLFDYWFSAERSRRLFFCQREAIETIVYLLEMAIPGRLGATGLRKFQVDAPLLQTLLRGDKPAFAAESDVLWPRLVDVPSDSSLLPLRRLGCKMATGSGKTVVMAMVIAWAFCNRGRNPMSRQYPNGVLVCAPNLTVKRRLQVLRPDEHPNYYEQFDLIPAKYRDLLGTGKVLVTNWQGFGLKSPHREGDESFVVVDKGEEPNDAFTKDRLGELADRLPILVLNDEGHHCWRPNPGDPTELEEMSPEQRKALEEDAEEARVWLAGLDRINNAGFHGSREPGVLAAIDLSATPFYLANSGYPAGSPFPWLISDYGLLDAIESGIVKIPRLPVLDDTSKKDEAGRPDPRYFRLWRHIAENIKSGDKTGKRWKPESILREAHGALQTLASQWHQRFESIQKSSNKEQAVPPVMIVVCDNTDLAKAVYQEISGEQEVETVDDKGKTVTRTAYGTGGLFPELQNEEGCKRTIRIDTKLLAKIETEEGESKDEAAKALRELIDTVGKRGGRGEQVRCVVSVSMLTEGWDATNVTHILGIRAFDSQLLCEQVVGRGLRRMSYDVDPQTKKLSAEYVDVYGVPFSLIPFKGKPPKERDSDPVQHRVFAVPDKAAFTIRMPVVEGYTYDIRKSGIEPDFDQMEPLDVKEEPTTVYLTPTRGVEDQGAPIATDDYVAQTREAYYKATRFQQLVFRLAQLITEDLVSGATGPNAEELRQNLYARHQIFPTILKVVTHYIETKVRLARRKDGTTVDVRELGLKKYSERLRERVRAGLLPAAATVDAPLRPIINSYEESISTETADFHTTWPVRPIFKSHLNYAVVRSSGEGSLIGESTAIDVMESMDSVECFAPNHKKLGFALPYDYQGDSRRYEPDFIVRMRGGTHVLLEIKGGKGELHNPDEVNAKNAGAATWVSAVNRTNRWARWQYEICRALPELRRVLNQHARGQIIPFRRVADVPPKKGEVAIPLHELRIAAGRADRFQFEQTPELVIPETTKSVAPGMVIAKVEGDSMMPLVSPGAYCLFAPLVGDPDGKIVLVELRQKGDQPEGGRYLLKRLVRVGEEQVRLESENGMYQPIVVQAGDEIRVVAELREVLKAGGVQDLTS